MRSKDWHCCVRSASPFLHVVITEQKISTIKALHTHAHVPPTSLSSSTVLSTANDCAAKNEPASVAVSGAPAAASDTLENNGTEPIPMSLSVFAVAPLIPSVCTHPHQSACSLTHIITRIGVLLAQSRSTGSQQGSIAIAPKSRPCAHT